MFSSGKRIWSSSISNLKSVLRSLGMALQRKEPIIQICFKKTDNLLLALFSLKLLPTLLAFKRPESKQPDKK